MKKYQNLFLIILFLFSSLVFANDKNILSPQTFDNWNYQTQKMNKNYVMSIRSSDTINYNALLEMIYSTKNCMFGPVVDVTMGGKFPVKQKTIELNFNFDGQKMQYKARLFVEGDKAAVALLNNESLYKFDKKLDNLAKGKKITLIVKQNNTQRKMNFSLIGFRKAVLHAFVSCNQQREKMNND